MDLRPSVHLGALVASVRERPVAAAVSCLLVLAAIPRLWAAWYDHGIFWPDEIYQSLEQGHRLAFGYGWVPWEFRDGVRSWVYPGVLGILLKLGAALGLEHGIALARLAKLAMAMLALWSIVASMKLASGLAGRAAGLLSGAWVAGFPPLIVFGSRCMSEMASAPLLVAAAQYALLPGTHRRRWCAGALAALATFARYQNGLVALGLWIVLVGSARWRAALHYAAAGAVVVLAGGVLDALTWHRPFHSLVSYIDFNFIQGKASSWGVAPFSYYFETAWTATGWPIVLVALGAVLALGRIPSLVVVLVVYLLAHSWVPHKEFRFVMPVVPLLLAASAVGFVTLARRGGLHRPVALMLAGSLLYASARKLPAVTLAELGQDVGAPNGAHVVWHNDDGVTLALAEAGKHADLCGVMFTGTSIFLVGGYSYLHRDVPMFPHAGAQLRPYANYLAAPSASGPVEGYEPVRAVNRDYTLYRRPGGCAPAPWFRAEL